MSLNRDQENIIKNINGPILVIAGAGSGKTRVITYRIAHMIKEIGIDPSKILALTFTKKAAREMKERISKMISIDELEKITLGTFHSTFSRILRKESHWLGYNPNYTIYDQQDSENVIKKILKDINVDINKTPREIIREISECKNNLYSKSLIKKKKSDSFAKIYEIYTKRCFQSNALDFDDILLYTNHLFLNFPNILKKYQEKFQYILIDEYQDTNFAQNVIIKNLSSKNKNVFVVGDDAQSIYAFRGANIKNILNFHVDYSEAKIFRLEQNYRSTNHIVQASNNIISFNKNQITKKIWTKNENGEIIKIYSALSDKDEAEYIANYIFSVIKKNKSFQYKNIAILYRTNKQSYIIEYYLKKKNIPYKIYGSISFFKRKEIRHLLYYFRVIINPNDEESILYITNKIIKNKNTVKQLIKLSNKKNIYDVIKKIDNYEIFTKKTKEKLKKNFLEIEKFRIKSKILDAYTIAKHIVYFLLELEKNYHYTDFQYILRNIFYYTEEQKKLKKSEDNSLSGFVQYLYVEKDIDEFNNENYEDKVSLMTVHLSKGLEFSIVFITGLEENLFPSRSSISYQYKIEEERRLFYVALTRAQKIAILTYTKYRFLWGKKTKNIPSRFINELHKKFIHIENEKVKHISTLLENKKFLPENSGVIKKGIIVFHKNFGIGTVIKLENFNKIAIVNFMKVGKKRILLQLNKLIIYRK
ncbi:ATP-dependent helicase [Blattabacterium cuenoti]|uniref:ATP-dependent helicase n=1 Tax=Blattabacterium cuenoti TaxID=1653831 RepID=UPI00163B72EF|nr:UvrD-helicase domain-containing protein [Blattabacterium cuenoti]